MTTLLVYERTISGIVLLIDDNIHIFSFNRNAKNGDDWTSKVYFHPEADKNSGGCYNITDKELIERLSNLVNVGERIEQAIVYKVPLFSWHITDVLCHNFVLFKTWSWWWTIEKNTEGITIQRSKNCRDVKDRYRQKDRDIRITELVRDSGRISVGDLIRWLYEENELNKTYDYLHRNCKHFAQAIFNHVTTSTVYFDQEANKTRGASSYNITIEQLIEKLLYADEKIEQIIVYKVHLSSWQITDYLFYYNFILFKTYSWWWTIEKNSEGITIQRSKNCRDVKDRYRQKDRDTNVRITELVRDSGQISVGDLILWLNEENELNKTYSSLWRNCKHFAQAIFNCVATSKKYPTWF